MLPLIVRGSRHALPPPTALQLTFRKLGIPPRVAFPLPARANHKRDFTSDHPVPC